MEPGIHELSAAYALDALDDEERDEFEAHLASCDACQEQVASFWEVGAALAVATSGPDPAPDLRERILAAAKDESHAPLATVLPFRSRPRLLPALAAAAAVAACAAIGLGIWAASLSSDLSRSREAVAEQRVVQSVLTDPDARSLDLTGNASGRVVLGSQGESVLVVNGLGNAPSGRDYEVWVIADGKPARAGLFDQAQGGTAIRLEQPVPSGAIVAVTLEADGGVSAPTSDPLVTSIPA